MKRHWNEVKFNNNKRKYTCVVFAGCQQAECLSESGGHHKEETWWVKPWAFFFFSFCVCTFAWIEVGMIFVTAAYMEEKQLPHLHLGKQRMLVFLRKVWSNALIRTVFTFHTWTSRTQSLWILYSVCMYLCDGSSSRLISFLCVSQCIQLISFLCVSQCTQLIHFCRECPSDR